MSQTPSNDRKGIIRHCSKTGLRTLYVQPGAGMAPGYYARQNLPSAEFVGPRPTRSAAHGAMIAKRALHSIATGAA